MSASRMRTFKPSAESPSARLTAVVDLPTPPLPEATAMIASTPGTPTAASPERCALRGVAVPVDGRAAALAGGAPRLAFCRKCNHGRLDAGYCAHRVLGALAHRLPALHRLRIDGE